MSPTPERSNDVDDDYSFSSDSEYKMDSLYLVLSVEHHSWHVAGLDAYANTQEKTFSHENKTCA
jgi:hypothetical protein